MEAIVASCRRRLKVETGEERGKKRHFFPRPFNVASRTRYHLYHQSQAIIVPIILYQKYPFLLLGASLFPTPTIGMKWL